MTAKHVAVQQIMIVRRMGDVCVGEEYTPKSITKEFTAESESSIIVNWDILLESLPESKYEISRIISDYPSDIYPTSFVNRKEIASYNKQKNNIGNFGYNISSNNISNFNGNRISSLL